MLPATRRRIVAIAATALAVAGSVAVGTAGAAPARPAAGSTAGWHFSKPYGVPHLGGAVDGLACPTVKECLTTSGNEVFWTTNATGGKRTWHRAALEPSSQPAVAQGTVALNTISCASVHLCVISDDIGNVFVSANPTGGKGAWSGRPVDQIELLALGCSPAGTCAAIDYYGRLLSTTNPAGAWHYSTTSLTNDPELWGVSCAKTLCAAVTDTAKIATTTNPGAATPIWHVAHVPGAWADVSCPTASKCVAVGGYLRTHGTVAVSTNPAHGTWKTAKLSHTGPNEIDCASASHCFADNDYSTTHAAAKSSAWKFVTTPDLGSQTAVSCPTTTRCYLGTSTNQFTALKR